MSFVTDLDSGLLKLSPYDSWTMRDAVRGLHFWGSIGAGKTTAAQMVAGAFLRAGCGGYITAVKPTELALWQRYAAQHGRSNSLILFDGENETFNFLDYLMATHGMDGIGSVTDCLMTVIDAARRASATASQRGGDTFWEDSARQALRFALPPIYSAKGSLTIPDIIAFITSAPMNLKEPADPKWQASSPMFKIITHAETHPRVPMTRAALKGIVDFWQYEFPAIPEKTRGNIVITITSALDRFRHGRLQRAFCGRTTLVPELSFSGAVILDAKPTTIWNEDGVIAQSLFKFLWQRCVLRRNSLSKNHQERFLFQWSDESQETVSPHDSAFLSLCRDSKCCVTYLTQSLPTYFAKIGGDNPKDSAMALATKFGSHVFCSNSCCETNEFASRTIGKVLTRRGNYSNGASESVNVGMNAGNSENWGRSSNSGSSFGNNSYSSNASSGDSSGSGNNWGENRGRGTSRNESRGYSESMEYAIEPGDFARALKSGGPQNGNEVTGIWFQNSRVFRASGTNFLLGRFKQ